MDLISRWPWWTGRNALRAAIHVAVMVLAGFALAETPSQIKTTFTLAVIPDTQNYVDHAHQRANGFPFDARELFFAQMAFIGSQTPDTGGDIRFVAALGDVWQSRVVPDIAANSAKPQRDANFGVSPFVAANEAAVAEQGYASIAGKVPFAVVPGNHDYDWSWNDGAQIRVGGLANFTRVFGARSAYFQDQSWYVDSHDAGGDSAQVFTAAGYKFVHIGLQFDPSEDSLTWAASVIARFPDLPTIISTHRFIDNEGRRPDDVGPHTSVGRTGYNSPEQVWQKFIRRHDQIFLVLSGHYPGQARRVDANAHGHNVWQILSDYQSRRQTAHEAGALLPPSSGIGDGWLRLMCFDLSGDTPTIQVRTYSPYYQRFSSDEPLYTSWYKSAEKPALEDAAFIAADDFIIELPDFRARFGQPMHD